MEKRIPSNERLTCQFCDSSYDVSTDVRGCCSIRCALDSEHLEECSVCSNTGMMEISRDPYVSDCIPCIEGCTLEDWWILRVKDYRQLEPSPVLDDSDIPF